MVAQQQAMRGPWPGPRPYTEADRALFFGREDEKYEVLERLDPERLMLLTAPSAVGKTSFLRAALVPELRRRRLHALRKNQPSAHSAVIVLRDWPAPDVFSVDAFFIEAFRLGVEDIAAAAGSYEGDEADLLRQEHALLAAMAPDGLSAFEYVQQIAREVGGLTLVLDQFEEALQGSARHVTRLSDLLVRLFNSASDVRILLSFREEFLSRIISTPLGRDVRDLPKRTYYLPALKTRALRDAMLDSSEAGNLTFDGPALDELLSWMVAAQERTGSANHNGSRKAAQAASQPRATGHEAAIDLLKLQALLLQLYEVSQADSLEPDIINTEDLDRLRQRFRADGGREVDGAEVVERALQRFIDSLLPIPEAITNAGGLPESVALDGEHAKMLRRRRAAARMGPSFSSGGFKVPQELTALLARAWREEWEVVGIEVDEVEDALRAVNDLRHNIGDELAGWLDDWAKENEDEAQEFLPLSGIAKRNQWSVRLAAIDLIATSIQALELLRQGNVLRRKALQGFVTYELVHDGFGDALFDWSEDVRAQPLDALSAIIAERGTAFRWTRLSGVVRDVCWRGCWIGPDVDQTKRLKIEDVRFENCDLRGTVFNRCDFTGGGFHHCDLEGAVFWDCTFTGTEGCPFVFDAVEGSSLSFDDDSKMSHIHFSGDSTFYNMSWHRLTVDDVTLDRCVLNKMTVGEVTLAGPMTIRNSWILLSDLNDLRIAEGRSASLLTISNCDLFYCRLRGVSNEAAERDASNLRVPDPREMSAEPALRGIPANKDPWREPS